MGCGVVGQRPSNETSIEASEILSDATTLETPVTFTEMLLVEGEGFLPSNHAETLPPQDVLSFFTYAIEHLTIHETTQSTTTDGNSNPAEKSLTHGDFHVDNVSEPAQMGLSYNIGEGEYRTDPSKIKADPSFGSSSADHQRHHSRSPHTHCYHHHHSARLQEVSHWGHSI